MRKSGGDVGKNGLLYLHSKVLNLFFQADLAIVSIVYFKMPQPSAQNHVDTKLKNESTFAFHGTSWDKKKFHFLERHVIINDKTETSLGFTEIAIDNSETQLEKLIEIIDD